MANYKRILTEFVVEEGLDTLEIEGLRDEMQEWVDNMSGTNLENTSKYEMAEEAVNQLDSVDSINFDEIWEAIPEDCVVSADELKAIKFTCYLFAPYGKGHLSRDYRLSNAVTHIGLALEAMEDYLEDRKEAEGVKDILQVIGEIKDSVEELDGVDFPGMYG